MTKLSVLSSTLKILSCDLFCHCTDGFTALRATQDHVSMPYALKDLHHAHIVICTLNNEKKKYLHQNTSGFPS